MPNADKPIRDGDDLDLTLLVNECWKKASFGYQINN